MAARKRVRDRRGTVLVLFAVSMLAIMAFMALAIDLGMLAVARTQCQDAADAAAMAGAGRSTASPATGHNNNYSNVSPNAIAAVTANSVLGKSLTSSQLNLQIGRYSYVTADQQFEGQFPGPSSQNWSLVQAQIAANVSSQLAFSKIFNFTGGNIVTTSTAIQRPRDIVIVLDYSGSMRFSSLLGVDYATSTRATNNPDTLVPSWGQYSSGNAGCVATSFTSPYDAANISTTTSDGRPPIMQDFYQDSNGTAASSAASSGYASVPGRRSGHEGQQEQRRDATAPAWATCSTIANPTTNTRDATFESRATRPTAWNPAAPRATPRGPAIGARRSSFGLPTRPTTGANSTSPIPAPRRRWTTTRALWDSNGNWLAPGASTYCDQLHRDPEWHAATSAPIRFPQRCNPAGSSTTPRFPRRSTLRAGRRAI